MTPVWVHELANRFWAAVGPPPAAPRDLTGPAFDFGPGVVLRPRLTTGTVVAYLADCGERVAAPDRPLRACLYSRVGRAFIFLDADDPPDERRFSLAHELAHFLRDCDAPRRRLEVALGRQAVGLLDGRQPTTDERIAAVLRGVSLGPHLHLMNRDDDGRPLTAAERESEDAADRLAGELLAPADLFDGQDADTITARLVAEFGLPPGPAGKYAAILKPPAWRDPLLDRLKIPR